MNASPVASITPPQRVVFLLGTAFFILGCLIVSGCDSGGGGSAEPPSVPTGLSAVQAGAAVDLEWQTALNAESYNVYRATGDTDVDASAGSVNGEPVTDTGFSDSSVQAGTVYSYSVTAVGEDGRESNASASITLRVFADPPARP